MQLFSYARIRLDLEMRLISFMIDLTHFVLIYLTPQPVGSLWIAYRASLGLNLLQPALQFL